MKLINLILFLCIISEVNAQWERVYTSQYNYIEDISFYDYENGAAVAVDGTAFISNTSGYGWTKQSNNYQYTIHGLCCIDKNSALMTGKDENGNNCIFKTIDKFKTFQKLHYIAESNDAPEFQRIRSFAGKYWALCSKGIIFSSVNSTVWEEMDFGDWYFRELIVFDENNAFLCGSSGSETIILKTTDSGNTWTETKSPSEVMINGFSFADKFNGWAAGNNGRIYTTTDGGISWTSKVLMSKHFKAISFVNTNEGWAVGTMGAIYSTIDGGENWSIQESGVNDDLHCITKVKIDDYNYNIIAGGGETSILLNEHTVLSGIENQISDKNNITISYSNEILTLKVNDSDDSYFAIEIFNINGSIISMYEFDYEQYSKEININVGNINPGLYFCKIIGNRKQIVKPILTI